MLDTIDDLSDCVSGRQIESVETHDDGLHINLSDGQIIIIVGALGIGLLNDKVSIQ